VAQPNTDTGRRVREGFAKDAKEQPSNFFMNPFCDLRGTFAPFAYGSPIPPSSCITQVP